jgi:hypothetical protein
MKRIVNHYPNLLLLPLFALLFLLPSPAAAATPPTPHLPIPATTQGLPAIEPLLLAPGSSPCHVRNQSIPNGLAAVAPQKLGITVITAAFLGLPNTHYRVHLLVRSLICLDEPLGSVTTDSLGIGIFAGGTFFLPGPHTVQVMILGGLTPSVSLPIHFIAQ